MPNLLALEADADGRYVEVGLVSGDEPFEVGMSLPVHVVPAELLERQRV